MSLRAAFFDLGGVILRTEFQAPRQHLAEQLGLEYEDLVRLVFESPTARQASVGALDVEAHWAVVVERLGRPPSEKHAVRDAFFAGDILDHDLLDFIRDLRPRYYTGLISNAWSDLRAYIQAQGFEDAFDHLTISAEVGSVKPDSAIYHTALERAGLQPEQAVFVDDFLENVEGCRAIGMHGIHFRDPQQALRDLTALLDGR